MKNYTGLLHPDIGTQQNPGAAAFFNNRLWYIGNGHDADVWTTGRTLDHLNPDDTKNESDYWINEKTQDQSGLKDRIKVNTARQPSLVVVNGYMYLIWVQKDDHGGSDTYVKQESTSVWATRMNPGDAKSEISWSSPVRLTDTNPNNEIFAFDSNFCVVAWGDYLVACCHYNTTSCFYAFDTNNWPSGAEGQITYWSAVKSHYQEFYGSKRWPKSGLPETQEELGDQISMDWFAVNGDNIYFVLSFFNQKTKTAYIPVLMQMKPIEEWDNSIFYHWNVEVWHGISGGVQMKTDPAGRVKAYFLSGEGSETGKMIYVELATNQVSPDGLMWGKFGPRNENGGIRYRDIYGQKQIVEQRPVPCFIWKNNPKYTNKDGKPATASEIYEFIMFKQDGINLKYSHYGRAVRVPNEEQYNPNGTNTPTTKQMYVLMGIVDAPIPLPAINVESRPTNYPNQTLGSVIYGTSDSNSKTHSASHNWSVGFKSSGKATNGVGPAWNVAINYGQGKLNGNSQKDQIFTEMKADTKVGLTSKKLNPQGTFFANQITIHRDAFYFYDYPLNSPTPTIIKNAPEVTRVWTQFNEDFVTGAFIPFSIDVGDLKSYTKAGINKRMLQKFKEYGNKGNIQFEESDYENYFENVINNPKNAVSFKTSEGASLYLEFSWGTSGSTSQKYQDMTSSFKEHGWNFNSSAYAGVSVGVGVSFFGIGEKMTSEFLAGGSYSMQSNLKNAHGASWGISLNSQLQSPSANPKSGEVLGYSWRLYFLKASQQWTDELIAFSDPNSIEGIHAKQIDPGAQPWRIVFVVNDEIDIE